MSISIRNRLPGTIEKIVSDKVVSEVVMRTAARSDCDVDPDNWLRPADETEEEGDNVFAVDEATWVLDRKGIVVRFDA